MHHYYFQYFSTRAALQVIAACVVVFLAAIFIVMGQFFFNKNFFTILMAVAAPILLFYNQRHRLVKEGEAEVGTNVVRIAIQGREENVYLSDLKFYRIDHNNGTALRLDFRDDRPPFKVVANGIYCDPGEFERFCNHFERVVILYNRDGQNKVARKTAFLVHRYARIWLWGATVFFVLAFVYGMIIGKEIRSSFYIAICSLLTLWTGHFTAVSKEKRYQRALDELDPVDQ